MDIKRLIPKDKFDFNSVNTLKILDINIIKPIISDLLEWTKDSNWPITQEIGDILVPLGSELIPYLRGFSILMMIVGNTQYL